MGVRPETGTVTGHLPAILPKLMPVCSDRAPDDADRQHLSDAHRVPGRDSPNWGRGNGVVRLRPSAQLRHIRLERRSRPVGCRDVRRDLAGEQAEEDGGGRGVVVLPGLGQVLGDEQGRVACCVMPQRSSLPARCPVRVSPSGSWKPCGASGNVHRTERDAERRGFSGGPGRLGGGTPSFPRLPHVGLPVHRAGTRPLDRVQAAGGLVLLDPAGQGDSVGVPRERPRFSGRGQRTGAPFEFLVARVA
jgi:hypothetical protein